MTPISKGGSMTIKDVSTKYDLTQDTLRYYERVGMIPKVNRTKSGIRDYTDYDLGWVELAKCMRQAGMSIESLVEYVKLYQQGDVTIKARLELLKNQKEQLLDQKQKIELSLDKLDYKISVYSNSLENDTELNWRKK